MNKIYYSHLRSRKYILMTMLIAHQQMRLHLLRQSISIQGVSWQQLIITDNLIIWLL